MTRPCGSCGDWIISKDIAVSDGEQAEHDKKCSGTGLQVTCPVCHFVLRIVNPSGAAVITDTPSAQPMPSRRA